MRRPWLLLGVLAACGPGGSSSTASAGEATVTDSAGVQLVLNTEPMWTATNAWHVDTVPVTSIGGDENDPNQQFKYIRSARRMSNGDVVVVAEAELRWFGPDGKYLRTTTRQGEGPGEFRYVDALYRLPGDTLVMSDGMGAKVATYAPDGSFVREVRLDQDKYRKLGRWIECQTGVFPDGSRYGCMNDASIPMTATNRGSVEGDPGPGLLRTLNRFWVASPALDTAHALGLVAGIEQFGVTRPGGGTTFVMHPFYSRTLIAAGGTPMRIALATNPQYSIEIWTPDGKLDHIIRRANGRRPPNAAENAMAPEYMKKSYFGAPNDPFKDQILAAVPTPDSLPAIVGLVVGQGGEVLVQREGLLPSQLASLFDVFDAAGRWLGELRLPPRVRIVELGADYLLGVRIDADDVAHVEVWHVTRSLPTYREGGRLRP